MDGFHAQAQLVDKALDHDRLHHSLEIFLNSKLLSDKSGKGVLL